VKRNLLIISGIEPGPSGTGRLLSYLVNQGARVLYSMQGLGSVEMPRTLSRYRVGRIVLRLVYAAPILYFKRWYFYARLYLLVSDQKNGRNGFASPEYRHAAYHSIFAATSFADVYVSVGQQLFLYS